MRRLPDLTGRRIGQWKVIRQLPSRNGQIMFLCLCTGCETEHPIHGWNLALGKSKSCFDCGRGKLRLAEASLNGLFAEYRRGAHDRGLSFSLSKKQFRLLTSSDCHYCGTAPSQTWTRGLTFGHYVYNGVDRKNSRYGYSNENCVSCCWTCNKMKRRLSYSVFVEQCRKIAKYRRLQ